MSESFHAQWHPSVRPTSTTSVDFSVSGGIAISSQVQKLSALGRTLRFIGCLPVYTSYQNIGGVLYQPILKGKKGEFEAWSRVSTSRRTAAIPLFDVVADKGIDEDLQKFVAGLTVALQPSDACAVDTAALGNGAVESVSGLLPYSWLATQLQGSQMGFRPVVHIDDDVTTMADALWAASNMGQPITLRLGGLEADPEPAVGDTSLRDFCTSSSLQTSDVHLLLDFASIFGADLAAHQRLAIAYLNWAAANGSWASVTLASGAFPAQISALPKQTANRIPRLDAMLWNLVNRTSPVPGLRYGDYGVRHPELFEGQVWNGPLPNLRYAADSDWIVWREAKAKQQQPNSSFYDVCASIAALPEYRGSTFSWGDLTVDEKSRRIPGPGGGTEWITCGTNLHMEFVIDRLATLGVA